MKRILRALAASTLLIAPFIITGTASPAGATCRPEKPSTCEPYCVGSRVTVGPVRACVPLADDIAIQDPPLEP